ncbi:MAG: hypothetical protein HONDAALG_01561 [Gammaproteobacteria bacterium]|nr:hypothetical protein [Gammaproteobacteria bacterium]
MINSQIIFRISFLISCSPVYMKYLLKEYGSLSVTLLQINSCNSSIFLMNVPRVLFTSWVFLLVLSVSPFMFFLPPISFDVFSFLCCVLFCKGDTVSPCFPITMVSIVGGVQPGLGMGPNNHCFFPFPKGGCDICGGRPPKWGPPLAVVPRTIRHIGLRLYPYTPGMISGIDGGSVRLLA